MRCLASKSSSSNACLKSHQGPMKSSCLSAVQSSRWLLLKLFRNRIYSNDRCLHVVTFGNCIQISHFPKPEFYLKDLRIVFFMCIFPTLLSYHYPLQLFSTHTSYLNSQETRQMMLIFYGTNNLNSQILCFDILYFMVELSISFYNKQ